MRAYICTPHVPLFIDFEMCIEHSVVKEERGTVQLFGGGLIVVDDVADKVHVFVEYSPYLL